MASCASVVIRQHGVVVPGYEKIGPTVLVEIEKGQGFGVSLDDETVFRRGHGGEMPVPVTAQQLTHTAVKASNRFDRSKGILYGIYLGMAVSVEIPRYHALNRGDLRDARQGLEPICAIGLA